jgi:4-hydroxy-3-polyprenylbenzoate decarboxylase
MDAIIKRIIIAITGASGAIYGIRLLEELKKTNGVETHLIISDWARETIRMETDYLIEDLVALAHVFHNHSNQGASISSGSFLHHGMVIIPCSMKTLAAVSHGYADSLITRAADVCLKEQRKMILVPRESPFSTIHLENMLRLSKLGAVIIPPIPAYYHRPNSMMEIIDQTVGKVLDHLGIQHQLMPRWLDEGQDNV